jgi:hypothetical protein
LVSTRSKIVLEKKELKYRLLEDSFTSPQECLALMELIEAHGQVGDGYGGNPPPHTKSEILGGYSFNGCQNKIRQDIPGHR